MSKEKQNNINLPAEYVPLINMIRKEDSIRNGITALKDKILISAGEEFLSWTEEKQNIFFERTAIVIAKDENLIKCFESTEGKLSIIEAIEKAVATGLQIGGKHAYLVPQPRMIKNRWITEVRFSIRDRGYYALLCGGKKPIFLDLRWGSVYEKDECTINKGNGEVIHNISISDDKGKFLGCWVQAKKINNQLEIEFYSISKINQWRDSSKAYKKALEKQYENNAWINWPEEMGLQASIRHFCERYEEARELLASALYDDEHETHEQKTSTENIDEALLEKNHKEIEEKEENTNQESENEENQENQEEFDLF